MKALELKHLAAYLPYDIEVFEIPSQKSFILDEYGLYVISDNWGYECYKPHLRPLSDLTKEITHSGETFLPIEKIDKSGDYGVPFEYGKNGYGNDHMTFFYADGLDSIGFEDFEEARQKLLEWHFDIFGLIDAGLAIDINTITEK